MGLGLITGLFLGTLGKAVAAPERDGQRHVLFVLVDDLKAEHPILQGIWLASLPNASTNWAWTPIYPTPLSDPGSLYSKPHAAFYLPKQNIQDVGSLPPLRDDLVWWDEAFWVDDAALNSLQRFSGGDPIPLADTWAEPQRALFGQVQIINSLCQWIQTASSNDNLDQILALMPDHLRSSSSSFELITRWDAWAQGSVPLNCSHPWAG